MRKKICLLILAMLFVFSGCDIVSFRSPAEKRKEDISNYLAKDVAAKTSETYQTKWFSFTIETIKKVNFYGGYKAKKDHQLYEVQILIKSNWEDPIPMGTYDFYMDAPDFEEYIWGIAPLDDAMMPEKFNLNPSESVQYVMVFEVPIASAHLTLVYTESYESGKDGKSFSIAVD